MHFHDLASEERIPWGPAILKVDVPIIDTARPGGVGLDDLDGLLRSQDYVSLQDQIERLAAKDKPMDPSRRTIDVRIERAGAFCASFLRALCDIPLMFCLSEHPPCTSACTGEYHQSFLGRVLQVGRILPRPKDRCARVETRAPVPVYAKGHQELLA